MRTPTGLAAGAMFVLALAQVCAAASECRVTTARLARTFYSGERVALNLQLASGSQELSYLVMDGEGKEAASGDLRVASNVPEVLDLGGLADGIYSLRLNFENGTTQREAFCVIPRPDTAPGDFGLWGFQYAGTSEATFAAMAQAGVRYLRFDLSWPDHEKYCGKLNTAKADIYAALCKRYGMQMIPTLGYTPGWTGLKPDDMGAIRAHTWCPDAVDNWRGYVETLRDRLGGQMVSWPPAPVVPSGSASQTIPLVRAWEIWNEVDQNFYYGPWLRYVDLLRVASKTLKERSYRTQVVYGGACAHWTEMSKTYGLGGQMYFDSVAWHSNGDIERELPKYYYGAPQMGYKHYLPRPTVHTECYPVTREGVGEADYLLRLYTMLKAWREEGYCYASIGQHLVGPPDPNSIALLYERPGGELIPNAKYVAYSVARWLLADAAYLGPLSAGSGAVAHVFARQGKLALVAWGDSGGSVAVNLERGAFAMGALGKRRALSPGGFSVALKPAPTVVVGLAREHVKEAMLNYYDLVMRTEYGFEYTTDSPYVKTLAVDCAWAGGDPATRIRSVLQGALDAAVAPSYRPDAFSPTGYAIRDAMVTLADVARRRRSIRPEVPTSLWRLQRMAEWVGEAADALRRGGSDSGGAGLAGESGTKAAEALDELRRSLDGLRDEVVSWDQGTTHPLSEALVQRAYRMQETGGEGCWLAAAVAVDAARAFAAVEVPLMRDIFIVGHFPTARQMIKGILFNPGQTHTLAAQVFNYTDREVSGTLTWKLPTGWSVARADVEFTAPARGASPRVTCQVSIPGGADSWTNKWANTPAGRYCVTIPANLSSDVWLELGGKLSDGRDLFPLTVEASVGKWVPGGKA